MRTYLYAFFQTISIGSFLSPECNGNKTSNTSKFTDVSMTELLMEMKVITLGTILRCMVLMQAFDEIRIVSLWPEN